jgi:hypothetical protein
MALTAKERDLMEHALGRDYQHKSKDYRNWYAAGRGGPDFDAWMSLVDRGLATKRTDVAWTPCAYFGVTDAGKAELDNVIAPPAPPADDTVAAMIDRGDSIGALCALVKEAGAQLTLFGEPVTADELRTKATERAIDRMADALTGPERVV